MKIAAGSARYGRGREGGPCRTAPSLSGVPMLFQAILREVDQLHNASTRLEALAEQHPLVPEPLITIAGSVRNAATVLEVLIATKGPKPI